MMWFLLIALGLLTAWPGGYALSRDDSCVDGDNGTCQELDTSLVQIKTDSPKLRSCEGELLATVAREIKLVQADAPHEEHMQAVFRTGCDPTTSSYSHHCADVKTAHLKTYAHLLQRLNEQVHTVGPAAISFGEFATIMLFQCMWRSRHNPGDPYGEKPYDTCTETDLCNMVTTKAGFETFLPQVSLKTLSGIRHAKHGWPGTGKDYSMVRVSLLHKSDGTSSSPETILGRSGLRLSVINGGWAKDATLHLEPKYHEGFQIAWGQIRNGMLPESKLGGPPLRLQSGLAAAEPGQGIRNFSDTGVVAKMPPAAGSPLTMVVIGDPCNGNFLGGGQCNLRDYYGVNKTLPVLLNAALPSSDVWYLTGDNFYDRRLTQILNAK